MHRPTALLLMMFAAACTSNARRIDARAQAAGLERSEIAAGEHRSLIYMKRGDEPFVVYLEGDGLPWRDGVEPNTDPTTRNPVALELLLRTSHAGAYVTRPCYHDLNEQRCTSEHWTSARYSEEIVASVATAIQSAARKANARSMTLVGYSGGGALAVLAAERLDNIDAVITIAANLDTDAWTTHHGYLPLLQSLNPSRSARRHPWPEIHLQGVRDMTVPPSTTAAYFQRYPSAQRRLFKDHDHVCCWIDAWPLAFQEARKAIEEPRKTAKKNSMQ
ncbi:MAG: alpha/beta fold hydrolase [Steroidobacter sp.]